MADLVNKRVQMNHAGARAILNSQGVRDELTRRARPVLAAARSGAPERTGAYKASLHIEQATTDRAVVRIVSNDPKALLVESRTGILARALDAAGGT